MECVELCRVEPIQEGENVLDRDKVSACIEPVMSVAHTTDTHTETPRSYSQMSRGTRQIVVGGGCGHHGSSADVTDTHICPRQLKRGASLICSGTKSRTPLASAVS
jgi:hypothetical protein